MPGQFLLVQIAQFIRTNRDLKILDLISMDFLLFGNYFCLIRQIHRLNVGNVIENREIYCWALKVISLKQNMMVVILSH